MIRSPVPCINKSFIFATLFRIDMLMTLTMFVLGSGLLILLTIPFNTYESSAQNPRPDPLPNPGPEPDPGPGPEVTNVPTLSEWGLIAMAGIVGFMIIRRRKASA